MMDKYTSECIEGAKRVIDKYTVEGNDFIYKQSYKEYSENYFWTNERIADYLSMCDLSNKDNALTVMASGDHPFNLIAKGIMNIDTFDSNKLTEFYVLGLKRAMVLKYSYTEFIEVIKKIGDYETSIEEINEIIIDLFPYMDERYRKYFQALIDYSYKLQNNGMLYAHFLSFLAVEELDTPINILKRNNNYLKNELAYNILRSKLTSANINFKYANALHLGSEFKGNSYDIIMLSNIMDYFDRCFGKNWTYDKLQSYEKELENIANNDAIMFLHYLYPSFLILRNGKILMTDSNVKTSDLTNEKLVVIPNRGFSSDTCMLLKRVNK